MIFSGGTALYDGVGHRYSRVPNRGHKEKVAGQVTANVIPWRCTFRTVHCPGSVTVREELPSHTKTHTLHKNHTCTAQPYVEILDRLFVEGRRFGKDHMEMTAMQIVNQMLLQFHEEHPNVPLPNPRTFESFINRGRSEDRPKLPKDCNFDIDYLKEHFDKIQPGFYR